MNRKHDKRSVLVAIVLASVGLLGCSDSPSSDDSQSPSSYFTIKLMAAQRPDGAWIVHSIHSLDFPPDQFSPDKWIVSGRFRFSSYDWEQVGGEVAWVDTVESFQKSYHAVVLKPKAKSGYVAAEFSAPDGTTDPPTSYFEGSSYLLIRGD